jgi:hypothetical protein
MVTGRLGERLRDAFEQEPLVLPAGHQGGRLRDRFEHAGEQHRRDVRHGLLGEVERVELFQDDAKGPALGALLRDGAGRLEEVVDGDVDDRSPDALKGGRVVPVAPGLPLSDDEERAEFIGAEPLAMAIVDGAGHVIDLEQFRLLTIIQLRLGNEFLHAGVGGGVGAAVLREPGVGARPVDVTGPGKRQVQRPSHGPVDIGLADGPVELDPRLNREHQRA